MNPPTSISIIVPAYNEERTMAVILDRLAEIELVHNIKKEIIVVNDCSKDQTKSILQEYMRSHPEENILYFEHKVNQGKGAAIHTGIREATGDFVIVQDADLEYDPEEINLLLKPVFKDNADVVYGSRFRGHHPHRILFFWHSFGNKLLTNLSNALTNLNITDMETCYKLVRTSLIKKIKLREKRFGFEPELTARLSKMKGIRIYEVGISYYGRTYNEGKKIGWKDGFRALYCIFRYNLFG